METCTVSGGRSQHREEDKNDAQGTSYIHVYEKA